MGIKHQGEVTPQKTLPIGNLMASLQIRFWWLRNRRRRRYFCTTAFSTMLIPSRETSLPFTVIVLAA